MQDKSTDNIYFVLLIKYILLKWDARRLYKYELLAEKQNFSWRLGMGNEIPVIEKIRVENRAGRVNKKCEG